MQKNNNPRELLAAVRNGDYAHPGEVEAVDIVFNAMDDAVKRLAGLNDLESEAIKVLDVGCGLGGTANYIKEKMGCDISGIDLDANAIAHATKSYLSIPFFNSNILEADKHYPSQNFDILYSFNVLYSFENKVDVLRVLSSIAKRRSLLIISDYTVQTSHAEDDLHDLTGKRIYPVDLSDIEATLDAGSWRLVKIVNLNELYFKWYSQFLTQLSLHKDQLLLSFTENAYYKVEMLFSDMLRKIKLGKLGGAIIFALKKD